MKKFVIALLAIALSMAALCGCSNNEKTSDEGTNDNQKVDNIQPPVEDSSDGYYTLQEAYERGLLSENDVMHISYFFTGSVYKVPTDKTEADKEKVDFTPTKATPVLDAETENKIKNAYYYHYYDSFKKCSDFFKTEYNQKDVFIKKYLGKYNNCVVAHVESNIFDVPCVVITVRVGDIVWTQGQPPEPIVFVIND